MVTEFHILPWHKWNYDEKPFIIGKQGRYTLLAAANRKQPKLTADGKRECVTLIETVNETGRFLPPVIISNGKSHTRGRMYHISNPETGILPGARFGFQENGYNTRKACLQHFKEHFELLTRPEDPSEHRLIFCDAADLHICADVLDFCIESKIHGIAFPAHTTHLLQPCDVVIFSPLQNVYGQIV